MMAFNKHTTQTSPTLRWFRLWVWHMAMFAIGCALATASVAAPSAGTRIHNQALATYTASGETAPTTIFSNDVYAIVQPVEALTLTQNNDLQRPAGTAVTFTHLLTNTGNVPGSYHFSWDTSGCTTPNLGFTGTVKLYRDVNGNGFVDTPDGAPLSIDANTSTPLAPPSLTLSAGAAANLLLQGTLPLAANGSMSCIRLIAKLSGSSLQAQNIDKVTITSNASVIVNKSVSYSGLAQPGYTVLTYTINASNIGDTNAAPTGTVPGPVSILVDGQPRSLVLIRDKMPAGAQYVAGSLNTAMFGAVRLFRLPGDADFSFFSAPTAGTGRDDAGAVEVAIGLPTGLKPGASFSMNFKVKLLDAAPSLVSNTAWVDFNDGTAPKEAVSNTAVVKTTSQNLGLAKAANVPAMTIGQTGGMQRRAEVVAHEVAFFFGAVNAGVPGLHRRRFVLHRHAPHRHAFVCVGLDELHKAARPGVGVLRQELAAPVHLAVALHPGWRAPGGDQQLHESTGHLQCCLDHGQQRLPVPRDGETVQRQIVVLLHMGVVAQGKVAAVHVHAAKGVAVTLAW